MKIKFFSPKIIVIDYLCSWDGFWIHLDKLDIAIRIHWFCMDIGHLSCYKPSLLNQYHRNYKLKIKEFKFCYFSCRENVITVIFTVGKSEVKVQAFVTFQSSNATLAVALAIGITSFGWVGHRSIRIAIAIIYKNKLKLLKCKKVSI